MRLTPAATESGILVEFCREWAKEGNDWKLCCLRNVSLRLTPSWTQFRYQRSLSLALTFSPPFQQTTTQSLHRSSHERAKPQFLRYVFTPSSLLHRRGCHYQSVTEKLILQSQIPLQTKGTLLETAQTLVPPPSTFTSVSNNAMDVKL